MLLYRTETLVSCCSLVLYTPPRFEVSSWFIVPFIEWCTFVFVYLDGVVYLRFVQLPILRADCCDVYTSV